MDGENPMLFFYFWEPHDVACMFAKAVVEKVGKTSAQEIDRMNASGMLGKYCASFDYCKPVEILYETLAIMEIPKNDHLFISEVWRECREKGFLALAKEQEHLENPSK